MSLYGSFQKSKLISLPDESEKQLIPIAGDAPDGASGFKGFSSTFQFGNVIAKPNLFYQTSHIPLILEADIHGSAEAPEVADFILLFCPLCLAGGRKNTLRISKGNKRFFFSPQETREPFPGWTPEQMLGLPGGGVGGLLSVEKFRCTWEEDPSIRRGAGFAGCSWHVQIERNVIIDVR